MENIQKNLSKSLFHTQILESELKQLVSECPENGIANMGQQP